MVTPEVNYTGANDREAVPMKAAYCKKSHLGVNDCDKARKS